MRFYWASHDCFSVRLEARRRVGPHIRQPCGQVGNMDFQFVTVRVGEIQRSPLAPAFAPDSCPGPKNALRHSLKLFGGDRESDMAAALWRFAYSSRVSVESNPGRPCRQVCTRVSGCLQRHSQRIPVECDCFP